MSWLFSSSAEIVVNGARNRTSFLRFRDFAHKDPSIAMKLLYLTGFPKSSDYLSAVRMLWTIVGICLIYGKIK